MRVRNMPLPQELEIGTLLLRVGTNKPAIVIGKRETGKTKYGTLDGNRKVYLIHECSGESWIDEIHVRAAFKLA